MDDSLTYSNERIFDFWEDRISNLSDDSQAIYRRALASLDAFLSVHNLSLSYISEDIVLDWAADLLGAGLAFHSMVQYINVLSSLVNTAIKEDVMNSTKVVKHAKEIILANKNNSGIGISQAPLQKLFFLLRMSWISLGEDEKYRDILLLSLLNGAMPLMDIAKLKRKDLDELDGSSMLVVNRHTSQPRRQYVFNLYQTERTPNQLKRDIYSRILQLLNRYVDPTIKNVDDALYSFWVLLAIKCGSRCSVALGCVPIHVDLYQPAFVPRAKTSELVRRSSMLSVGSAIINDPPQWYAMHLRRHVSYEDLKSAIQTISPILPDIELFYPYDAIALKVGKKLVYQNQPFIRDIVFFKSRGSDITPLFKKIGDKAWCYRVSNSPDAPYAVIPKSEFTEFQTAIGLFTEDTEIIPLENAIPNPGEEVVVIGSIWGERKGKFDRAVTDKTGKLLYRVVLSPDSGFAFRIDADPRNVKPV